MGDSCIVLERYLCSRKAVTGENTVRKASFEGREGRAVTESERMRIPDLDSRKAKGTTTMLFSVEEGDARGSIIRRRAQRPRRDVDLDKFSQVLTGSTSDDLIAEASYFVHKITIMLYLCQVLLFPLLFVEVEFTSNNK